VTTTLWSGPSLYDGLHPGATGASDMRFFDDDNLMQSMSEFDVNEHYSGAAWKFARENPRRTLELAAIKLWRFWKPWPSADEFASPWLAVATAGFFLPLVGFAIVGWWQCRRDWWALSLTAGPLVYFTALHALFIGSLRYRLPAEYPLAVLAAVGLWTVFRTARGTRATVLHG
jgi:hypothetical protein